MERMMREENRVQSEALTWALRGSNLEMEQQLQKRDEAFHALRQELDARIRRIERRLSVVEEKLFPFEGRRGTATTQGQESLEQLEPRIQLLEESVQSAQSKGSPGVEALEVQLEDHSSQSPRSDSESSSVASCYSSTSSVASSSSVSPTLLRFHFLRRRLLSSTAFSGDVATAPRKESVGRHQSAAIEGEQEKQPVQQCVQDGRAKGNTARTAPSSLGEKLCKAAYNNRLEEVDRLLKSGADVNCIDSSGDSPLICALRGTDPNADVVALLLASGAAVNAVDDAGRPALHFAARVDSTGLCVGLLISAGADVDATDADGATALHRAAVNDNEAAVRELVVAGARANLRCWSGYWRNAAPYDCARSPVVRRLLAYRENQA